MPAGVVADEHDALRVEDVAARKPAVDVAVHRGGVARAVGDAADPVGRADVVHEAPAKAAVAEPGRVALPDRERFRAVAVDHLLQAFGDVVHRLVPAHLLPVVVAARAHALQRMEDAVRMREGLGREAALHADDVLEDRVVAGGDLDDAPVLDLGRDRAEPVAAPADDVLQHAPASVPGVFLSNHHVRHRAPPAIGSRPHEPNPEPSLPARPGQPRHLAPPRRSARSGRSDARRTAAGLPHPSVDQDGLTGDVRRSRAPEQHRLRDGPARAVAPGPCEGRLGRGASRAQARARAFSGSKKWGLHTSTETFSPVTGDAATRRSPMRARPSRRSASAISASRFGLRTAEVTCPREVSAVVWRPSLAARSASRSCAPGGIDASPRRPTNCLRPSAWNTGRESPQRPT